MQQHTSHLSIIIGDILSRMTLEAEYVWIIDTSDLSTDNILLLVLI